MAKGPHAGQPDGAAGALDRVVAATCLAKLHGVQACRQIVLNPRGCACARQTFGSTDEGPSGGFLGQYRYGRPYTSTRRSQRREHFHLPKAALIWPRLMAAAMRTAAATMFAGPRISLRSARLRLGTPQRENSTIKYTSYSSYIPPVQAYIFEVYCAGSMFCSRKESCTTPELALCSSELRQHNSPHPRSNACEGGHCHATLKHCKLPHMKTPDMEFMRTFREGGSWHSPNLSLSQRLKPTCVSDVSPVGDMIPRANFRMAL